MQENYQHLLFNSLKTGLKHYFEVCSETTETSRKEEPSLSASIYQLEAYVAELKKKHKVDKVLNPFINSASITRSFEQIDRDGAHRQADYQLPFLFFLFRHYRKNIDHPIQRTLHELIDDFVEAQKESLTHHDIVLTATGATRCKTNIRFALDHLRRLGLILSLDEEEGRFWAPSLFGILVVMFLHLSYREAHKYELLKGGRPGDMDRYPINVDFNPRLYRVVKDLHRLPEEFICFLDQQDFGDYLFGEASTQLMNFIDSYQSLILNNINVENPKEGQLGFQHLIRIKLNPRFGEESRGFFRGLMEDEEFKSLYRLMLQYFSHPKFDNI